MATDEWEIGLAFVIIGVLMLIAEASAPGFFIAIPATVLIALGLIGMTVPGFLLSIWSPVLALIVAIPATIATMLFYRTLAPPSPPTTTVGESLVGKQGIVTAQVVPESIKGKVKIENQIWSATANEVIPEGAIVQVVQSRGVHVVVRQVAKQVQAGSGGIR